MTQILRNPGRVPRPEFSSAPVEPVGPGPRTFHRRLPGYEATPLVEAPALAAELGVGRLWCKDESARLGLPSFKILGASWAVYRLLTEKLGAEPEWHDLDGLRAAVATLGPLSLVAATDGNHGRAVARMAKLLGLGAHVLVPAGTADARITGIESEGAKVDVVDGTYDDAVAASAALADEHTLVVSDTSWEGYTEVPASVIEGYATIFAEVDEQLAALDAPTPDVVLVPMGVGALTAAVVADWSARATVIAVEPLDAACGLASAAAGGPTEVPGPHESIMAGLNCGNVSVIAWPAVHAGVDLFVAVPDADAEQAMRDLDTIGIEAGETGGAALAGLRAVAGDPEWRATVAGKDVLVLCTEGATDPAGYEARVRHPPRTRLA
ncbi:MAG: diaminopropionate ammonia-lyase [Acidimicrobiia bacterium]